MQTTKAQQFIDFVKSLSPAEILEIAESLGPCQISVDLFNILTELRNNL